VFHRPSSSRGVRSRRSTLAVIGLAAAAVLPACSSSSSPAVRPPDQPGPPIIPVTLTATGCSPQSFTLPAGPVIFQVTNPPSATPVSVGAHYDSNHRPTEMEVQNAAGHEINDVEGVVPGRTRSFLVNLELGKTYRARCPETQIPWGTITVTPPVAATTTTAAG